MRLAGFRDAAFRVLGGLVERRREMFWTLLRESKAGDERSCLKTLGLDPEPEGGATALLDEVDAHLEHYVECCRKYVSEDFAKVFRRRYPITGIGGRLFLFAATRLLKPEVVVETGCAKGHASSMILLALERNQKGRLVSIDLPVERSPRGDGEVTVARTGDLGCFVPESLASRWTLILGDVRDELPPLLKDLGEIDMFFHDSDHGYGHMMWEYCTAWPFLRHGGLLVSDDISLHTAFLDFTRAMGADFALHRLNTNFGAARKAFCGGDSNR